MLNTRMDLRFIFKSPFLIVLDAFACGVGFGHFDNRHLLSFGLGPLIFAILEVG